MQFAYVGGGIVIAYNPGSGLPYNLKLSADTIGKIFSGQIVNWDDPQIATENEGVSLPDLKLRVAARSDSSGTSHWFTTFMAQTSHSWPGGTRDVFDAPPLPGFPGLLTVAGSSEVADAVRDNPGMIGYVELSFARERRLNAAAVQGKAGFVLPETSAVTDAIAALSPNSDGTVTPSFTTAPGYPLSVVTYLLVRQDNASRQTALNLRTFAGLLLANNDNASSLAYAPLSPSLTAYAKEQIATIGPGGSVPASTTVPPPSSAPPTVSPTVVVPTTVPTTTPVTGSTSGWLIAVGFLLVAVGYGLVRLEHRSGPPTGARSVPVPARSAHRAVQSSGRSTVAGTDVAQLWPRRGEVAADGEAGHGSTRDEQHGRDANEAVQRASQRTGQPARGGRDRAHEPPLGGSGCSELGRDPHGPIFVIDAPSDQ